MRDRSILALGIAAFGLSLVLSIGVKVGLDRLTDPSPYLRLLDGMAFPASWELVEEVVRAPGRDKDCSRFLNITCPSVTRYYVVDSTETGDIYQEAKGVVLAAGLGIVEEFLMSCISASGDTCTFYAGLDGRFVAVTVYDPGRGQYDLGLDDPGISVVRMMAHADPFPCPPGGTPEPSYEPTGTFDVGDWARSRSRTCVPTSSGWSETP